VFAADTVIAPITIAAAGSGLLLTAHSVSAQEFCVACTGPTAVYRCVIGDFHQAKGQPLQQFCTSTLAMQGGHAECGIRKGTVFDCDGPITRIGEKRPGPDGSHPSKTSIEPGKLNPRDNVADTVRNLSRGTGMQMEKAGEAGKGAAQSMWNCVTSLFKSC
jgi:hypothetical protein